MTLILILCVCVFVSAIVYADDQKSDDDKKDGDSDNDDSSTMEEVVVTGTRVETQNLNVPADIQVIGEDHMKRPGNKNFMSGLEDISGVKSNLRQENFTFGDFEVRGLPGNATSGGNVLILLDGIPQRRLSYGGPYLGALPFEAVTRMELVKGPMGSAYGRNALTGALQLFTDPGTAEPHLDVGTSFEFITNTSRSFVKGTGPLGKNPIGGTKLSTYSITGSFAHAEGWQPRTESQRQDLYVHMNYRLSDKDTVKILGGFFNVNEGMAAPVLIDKDGNRWDGIYRDENLAVPNQNVMKMQEFRAATRYSRMWIPQIESRLTFGYWNGDTAFNMGRPDAAPTEGTVLARLGSDRHFEEDVYFSEAEIIAKYKLGSWLAGSLDVGASYEFLVYILNMSSITTSDNVAEDGTVDFSMGIPLDLTNWEEPGRSTWVYGDWTRRDTFEKNQGVFARKQFAFFDRVFASGGIRYDKYVRTQKIPATKEDAQHKDDATSPSVGLNIAVLKMQDYKLNVWGGWGKGYSPTFRAVANTKFADVLPETSESYEAGLKTLLFGNILELSGVYYELERKDIVDFDVDGNPINSGVWRFTGEEADIKIRPIQEVLIYGSVADRTPEVVEYKTDRTMEGKNVDCIAETTAAGGVTAKAPFGLGGGVDVRYVSSSYGDVMNEYEIPAYTLVNAWLYYDWDDHMRASVFARNITDEEYYSAVFADGSAFEGTPRTYGMSLKVHF